MGELGPTTYHWRPAVRAVVEQVESSFPAVKCNTYPNHPFPNWERVSFDAWGRGGRGFPIPLEIGFSVIHFVLGLRDRPQLRHYIYLHTLWTEWGGESYWAANDHIFGLRHVHFTFYK